ncbi:MAG: hypothetical protein O2800_04475 [Planctomycetota bacterium]|nr:hypothetical protein [Planctomycetota bacterium]
MFLGEFQHSLDAKQRLAIPNELRRAWRPDRHGEAFIAAPGANGALWLWPEKTFESYAGDLGGSLVEVPAMADFQRRIFSQSAHLPIDSSGRIRLPERMLTKHGLAGSIMLIGAGHHVELFSPQGWDAEIKRLDAKQTDLLTGAAAVANSRKASS